MASFYGKAYRKIYWLVRLGARLAVFTITGLAMLGAIIVGLTQLSSFRGWAVEQGLQALNKELQARVEIGEVSGSFLTGLEIHDLKLIADSTTLISSPLVELNYQLEPIFNNKVLGARAILHQPVVRLIRSPHDSTWNFEHITKPSTDSIKTPFNWDIDVAALEFVDAQIWVHDLTVAAKEDTVTRAVDYGRLELEHANLALQAHITPTAQSIWIQHLSFSAPKPDIRLIELAGTISVDTTGLTVDDLRIETDRTDVVINGHIDSMNVFGAGDAIVSWQQYPMSIEVEADRISTLELKRFVPETAFLGGSPSLHLVADGRFDDLQVQRLELGLHPSTLSLTGRIKNMNRPDSLYLDVALARTRLSDRDVETYIPGLPMPDLDYLGTVDIRSATFKGVTDHFVTTIDATTAVGSARGGARLDLRRPVMEYAVDLALVDADLAPIVQDRELASDFTGRVVANGRGTTLRELDARVRLESQASTIAERSYRQLYFDGRVHGGGIIDIDTVAVAWGAGGAENPLDDIDMTSLPRRLEGNLETFLGGQLGLTGDIRQVLNSSGSTFGASGTLDMRNPKVPRYKLNASGRDFDPSTITLDEANASRLSFTLDADGSAIVPDDIVGVANLRVTDAEIGGKRIAPFNARVEVSRQSATHRTLDLQSSIADANVTGMWRFETIVPGIVNGVEGFINYVGRKAQYREESVFATNTPFEPINAQYQITLKDLSPIQLLLGDASLIATGRLEGAITGTRQLLSISAFGKLDRFSYTAPGTSLSFASTTVDINLNQIAPGHIDDITSADISIRSDSLLRYGDLTLSVPDVRIELDQGRFHVRGATAINKEISVAVDGIIDVRDPAGYRVALDTLIVGLSNGQSWRNVRPVQAVASGEEIRFDTVVMQRKNAEIVSITGALAGDQLRDIEVTVQSGSLRSITNFARGTGAYSALETIGGSLREGRVRLNGTLDRPIITADLQIDSLAYGGAQVGDFRAQIEYEGENISGQVAVLKILRQTPGGDSLAARIEIKSLPIDLALASREERFISGRPVDIVATTNDLPIAFAAPFLPGVRVLGGTTDANFTVKGIYPDIQYQGTAQINRGRILVEGNNIVYNMAGALSFQDNKLRFDNVVVRNDPRDLVNSNAVVSGYIEFDGLEPGEINILAKVDRLMVLSDATQAVNDFIYGDLVIASGEGRDINFHGTIDEPHLDGDIVILSGNLRLPQTTSRITSAGSVQYVDYDEWLDRLGQQYGPPVPTMADSMNIDTTVLRGSLVEASRGIQDYMTDTSIGQQTGTARSFTDALQFNLGIDIVGRLHVRVDFSPIEVLRAVIANEDQMLHVRKGADGIMKVSGKLVVREGSEFSFLKRFDATGTLNFREDIENPNFSITAIHENRRLTQDGNSQTYRVIVRISGTKKDPKFELDYDIDGRAKTTTAPESLQRDAISLLLFGFTSEELTGAGLAGHAQTLLQSSYVSAGSSVVSSLLNEALSSTGAIRQVNVELGGAGFSDISQARLNVVAQFGKVVARYNGQVSAPNNSTISIELPGSLLGDLPALRRFTLQLQRELETLESASLNRTSSATTSTEIWRARIQYRVTW